MLVNVTCEYRPEAISFSRQHAIIIPGFVTQTQLHFPSGWWTCVAVRCFGNIKTAVERKTQVVVENRKSQGTSHIYSGEKIFDFASISLGVFDTKKCVCLMLRQIALFISVLYMLFISCSLQCVYLFQAILLSLCSALGQVKRKVILISYYTEH